MLKHRHQYKLGRIVRLCAFTSTFPYIINVIVGNDIIVTAVHVISEIIDTPLDIVREYDDLLFICESQRFLVITH
jgi:hypothetical protein